MKLEELKGYSIIRKEELKDINSVGYVMKHDKTKAKVIVILNDDDNKTFGIGFRTPPTDSTGVAHIIEHSVLEGSESFPVKDPFVELCKGSLNTFLNAMTFPDKTLYPVASCNDLDLHNLIHVYMDAVLRPNIYKSKNIFLQEGWRYEIENPEDDLNINGIVYSEMKGAFSDVDDIIDRTAMHSLYPDTVYGNESGGDPDFIPELTYEGFLDFHKRYYHPSNSYIYLYGNVDATKELKFIDDEYLSKYDYLEIDSSIDFQKAFDKRRDVVKEYAIGDEDDEKTSYHYTLNYSVGTTLEDNLCDAIDVLDYALCSVPGAPLKEALINAEIAEDVYSSYESCVRQPYFSIIAKGCKEKDSKRFLQIANDTLEDLVKNGIDKLALKAGLNFFEFKYREGDYGAYPKGLMYLMQMFDSWLYDEEKPFMHILRNDTYDFLKKQLDTDYFEKILDKYFVKNNHSTFVTLKPVKELTAKNDEKLKKKLAKIKENLSKDELELIIKQTKDLKAWQEMEDTPEALLTIPMLTKEDINKNARKFCNEERSVAGGKALFHNIFTNKIAYVRLVFDVNGLDEDEISYFALYKNIIGLVNTKNYSYGELFNQIHIATGGMTTVNNIYTDVKTGDVRLTFDVKASVLYENMGRTFELIKEILFESDFSDKKRLKDLVNEQYTRFQGALVSTGHAFAYLRALKGRSKAAYLNDNIDGVGYFEHLEKWYKEFDKYADEIIEKMNKLSHMILRPENFMFDFTGDEEGYGLTAQYIPDFKELLYKNEPDLGNIEFNHVCQHEGLKNSSQVQYVACGGNFKDKGIEYSGVINVLKVVLSYDYLWTEVRVKGGAYGCMNILYRNGDGCFVSYRDPNLAETIDAFKGCADYIEKFEADERTITKYVIGAIGNLDTPLTPVIRGFNSLNAYMTGLTNEMVQKEREEVINTDIDAIRNMSKLIRAIMDDSTICVVGNALKIEENKDKFDVIRSLITA